VVQKYASFAPARQKRLGFRLRSYKRGVPLKKRDSPLFYTMPAQPWPGDMDIKIVKHLKLFYGVLSDEKEKICVGLSFQNSC